MVPGGLAITPTKQQKRKPDFILFKVFISSESSQKLIPGGVAITPTKQLKENLILYYSKHLSVLNPPRS